MPENFNKRRILKNSFVLYARMLFTMWLNLYATRLVLANLGLEDMGVYSVVGSIVSLFTIFTGGITSAVQRFMSFELGLKQGNPNKIFCSSLNVVFILSFLVFILLEFLGLWILNNKIEIPEASQKPALWVFQFSVFTCIANMISIPYNALIVAHEKMDAFAIISIIQVVLNFAAAYSLTFFNGNRLFLYAMFISISSISVRVIYQIYCHHKFSEATYHLDIDWSIIKQIGKFIGLTSLASFMQLLSSQGIVFIINWIFGVTINAVYNITLQLKNSILSFSLNIERAISPQITKTYANNDFEIHRKLVCTGSKMEVFLIYIIMIPFLFRTEYIMKLWLDELPNYIVPFTRAIIFVSLINALYEPIRTATLATNKIRNFMLVPNVFYLLTLPISYIVGKLTDSPICLISAIVLIEIMTYLIRIYYASKVSLMDISLIVKQIVLPCVWVGCLSVLFCGCITTYIEDSLVGLLVLLFINFVSLLIIIMCVGLSEYEYDILKNCLIKRLKKRL